MNGKTRRLGTSRLASILLCVEAQVAPGECLYLASDLNGWNPSDARYRLEARSDGRFERTISLRRGESLEFKLTRGGWSTVEVGPTGKDIPNRRLASPDDGVVKLEVSAWRDQFPQKIPHSTVSGDIRTLGEVPMEALGRRREVLVYLPPDYDEDAMEARHFPVLYMFDGQNLFDEATAFSGEWGIDKTLDRLIKAGELAPLIVVAIYNGGVHRIPEQSPWPMPRQGFRKAEADIFLDWVVQDLKPLVDRKFRTLTTRDHTGIAGSSMGGLTALYAAYRNSQTFGRVAALSPSLWVADKAIFGYLRERPRPEGTHLYLDCGHLEGVQRATRMFARTAEEMVRLLESQGFRRDHDLLWVDDPEGMHNEAAWGRRFPGAVKFLWPISAQS